MTTPSGPQQERPTFTRGELKLVFAVTVLALVGLGIVAVKRLGLWPGTRVTVETVGPRPAPMDLNRAEWWELATLPGVGKTRARAIVETRRTRNGFKTLNELTRIPGIGPGLLKQLKPLLKLGTYKEEAKKGPGTFSD